LLTQKILAFGRWPRCARWRRGNTFLFGNTANAPRANQFGFVFSAERSEATAGGKSRSALLKRCLWRVGADGLAQRLNKHGDLDNSKYHS